MFVGRFVDMTVLVSKSVAKPEETSQRFVFRMRLAFCSPYSYLAFFQCMIRIIHQAIPVRPTRNSHAFFMCAYRVQHMTIIRLRVRNKCVTNQWLSSCFCLQTCFKTLAPMHIYH